MHELALTESLVSTVAAHVTDGARVRRVQLEVGKLSGVVPDAMRFCFDVCAAGTALQGARLEIDEVAARVHCRDCDASIDLEDAIALCDCGSANLEFLRGRELRIKEVEID